MDDLAPPKDDGGGDGQAWMATFADLATLLLTFFVLLLSFANMDVVKFREMMGSVKEALGYQKLAFGNWNPETLSVLDKDSHPEQARHGSSHDQELAEELKEMLKREKLETEVELEVGSRGVVVRVKDALLFPVGSDELNPDAFGFLDGMSKLLQTFPYNVLVEGHTDDAPARSRKFSSNWELSSRRSIVVVHYLLEVGGVDRSRLGAAGYADSRPRVSNDSAENRATNRRVEFVCYRKVGALIR